MSIKQHPLRTFRVSLTDRKNRRTVQAASPGDAIYKAVGKRCNSLKEYYCRPDTKFSGWGVVVATGTPQNGRTPVREILAYVETICSDSEEN